MLMLPRFNYCLVHLARRTLFHPLSELAIYLIATCQSKYVQIKALLSTLLLLLFKTCCILFYTEILIFHIFPTKLIKVN